MTFAIDEAYLPATLTAPTMSDEDFAEFCADYPDYCIEMTAEGEIVIMPPAFSLTGARNHEINRQLGNWAVHDTCGISTDASTGFRLPSGARRSPDAGWTRREHVLALSRQSRETYWHLCPDFVIELRSTTDRLPKLRLKMREWIANGAELAWLIDPERRAVEVFRLDREPDILTNISAIKGEGPVEGFTLDLGPVWEPLGVS